MLTFTGSTDELKWFDIYGQLCSAGPDNLCREFSVVVILQKT
jgi:hypothetical protein